MKNMKYTFGALLLLISLCSCSNLFNKDVTKTKDSNTYVMLTSDSVSVRSISPTQEYALEKLESITFSAKMDGKSKRTLASSVASLSVLYNYQFVLPDGAGSYTFELQGTLDSVNYYAKLTDIEIKEGETNPISFELKPVKGAYDYSEFEDFGGLSCTLNFNKTNVNKIHYKLENLSSSNIVDQGDITSFTNVSNSSYNSKATYKHLANNTTGSTARLPVGQYRLTFDFLTEDTSLNDFVVINSFPYIVNVEKGRNSYLEENFDLSQVYTITYNADGGSPDLGSRMQTKFTSKHEVYLPNMQKDGYTFQGWYTTSNWVDSENNPTGPINRIQNATADLTFYAKFADSVIYVDPTTESSINDGSKENPVKTLSAAIAKIKAIETTDQSDWLQWYIKVKGTITESLVVSANSDGIGSFKAKGITFVGASDLKNGELQDVIRGDGSNPVFTIATSTQVSFKNIKITGGKNSQSSNGAGIVMKGSSIVTIEDGTLITGNTASTNGGGIAVFDDANLMLAGGEITGNTCGTDKHGNDIYCSDSGHVSVCGNLVVGDLYLPQYNNVNLIDNMTDEASITITPDVYSAVSINEYQSLIGQELISVPSSPMPGMDIIEIKRYFHITPQAGSDIEWFIDDNGYLNRNYTVTFKGNGIETPIIKTVESAAAIPLADDPSKNLTREGYVFNGWGYTKVVEHYNITNSQTTYTTKLYQFAFDNGQTEDSDNRFTHIDSDLEVYAVWGFITDNINVSAEDGVDFIELDSNENLIFGDGTSDLPLHSINSAVQLIKDINDGTKNYTITVSGQTEDYNIEIDETVPAQSITLQGKNSPNTDGISFSGQKPDEFESLFKISGDVPVIFNNIKIAISPYGYYKDGIAINVGTGATVTLDNNAILEGFDGPDSINQNGIVAVENGGSFIMNTGSLIKDFEINHGAVYVKNGGTFTMYGGEISNILSPDSNIYVEGTFVMEGGSITANKQYNRFTYGTVHVASGASFTMKAGTISNNKLYMLGDGTGIKNGGGGVFVAASGTFNMEGGTISGNQVLKKDINYEDDTPNCSAYGGGVCIEATGTSVGSFTMTGGTISGNTAGTSGNGIGFLGSLDDGVTGTISLGGDAIITDNDIYLPSNVTITIVEPMTGGLTPSIRATITPAEYKANQPILNNKGVSLEYEYDYFAVTPQSDGTITTHWFIDENGKLYKYSVGDLLLTNGTFVCYDESHTFSGDEVSAAVGLVYGLDEEGKPRGILGLKNSSGASPYIATPWAPQSSSGYSIKFEDIICTPSNDGDTVSFTGDTDGSDNWDYICKIDQTGSADPATNYPAFNYVLNYVATVGLTDSDYDSGWYMPSTAEMYDIYKNLTTINSVLTKIKDINSASANTLSGYYFWTSSQADAAEVGNSAWYINITATSNPFTSSNKDWDSPSVCCIRKYKKQ